MRQGWMKHDERRGVFLLFLALTLLGMLQAVALAAEPDTVVMARNRAQDNMDPHLHFQRVGIIMNVNMYDSLRHKNTHLAYEPSLATSWKTSDDTTWEFTLRQGGTFHNGDPFTAEDVKCRIERVLDPATQSPQYGNMRAIKAVKILDAYTVQLLTEAPFPLLLEPLVFFPIIPRKPFLQVGAQAFAESAPVGTGPYRFVAWQRDQ